MKPSFATVNFTLRPKKQIERKIIIECLREVLGTLGADICRYEYVGMGSIYYYDFILFHKFLSIKEMTSIDKYWTRKRFIFNRPYDFINFKNIDSSEFLQQHKFNGHTILWMDYDYSIFRMVADDVVQTNVLDDLLTVVRKAKSGDIFMVTIRSGMPPKRSQREKFFKVFSDYIGNEYLPGSELSEKETASLLHKLLLNYIEENSKFSDLKFRKLFAFSYNDGTPMYTLGGIFHNVDVTQSEPRCIRAVSGGEEIATIDVPNLTFKEKMHLDARIRELEQDVNQTKSSSELSKRLRKLGFELDSRELKSYLVYYRYYPQYFESVI